MSDYDLTLFYNFRCDYPIHQINNPVIAFGHRHVMGVLQN